MSVSVKSFFHEPSRTFSYLVWEAESSLALVIDSVMDYDSASAQMNTKSADQILAFVNSEGLQLVWILETHVHADHLTAASYLRSKTTAKVGVGAGICDVQETFKGTYNLAEQFESDGTQFDHLFNDGDQFAFGGVTVSVMNTPGHTRDSVTYLIDDAAFIGDTLFMPDYGTARCDFPGGSASTLFDSVQRIYGLPDETRLYLCHDYIPEHSQRALGNCVSVAEQKAHNIQLRASVIKEDFIKLREGRDLTLNVPSLIIPAIQVNIRAGGLPAAEDNGTVYLKVPLNVFGNL